MGLLLAACEAGSSETPDPSASVAADATPAACPAALIEGDLVSNEAWGLALRDTAGMLRQVLLPDGFSVRGDPPPAVLLDEVGAVVATDGDHVEIEGGETGSDGAWNACGGITVVPASSSTVPPSASIAPPTAEPSAPSPVGGPVAECGRISPAACETAIALARAAGQGEPGGTSRIVVDDLCPPTTMCDRKYPFDSLVVFVTAGADTTGWYAFEVTGLKDDTPTKAKPWLDYVPAHIVKLLTAGPP